MTTVRFYARRGRLTGFCARGHAGHAPEGQDIVCAAISALTQTAAASVGKVLGLDADIREEPDNAVYRLAVDPPSRASARRLHDLLCMLYVGLADIAAQYPKHLRVLGSAPRILSRRRLPSS